MYIDKYWGEYIGGTDDSLTLVDYLAEKETEELSLGEIFSDFGLDRLDGDFRRPPVVYTNPEGWEMEIDCAIDLVTDLAALLLECRVNGHISLGELQEDEGGAVLRLTATPAEHELMNRTLKDFAANPLAYDLSEVCSPEEMGEMAAVCEALRKELYEA